MSSTAPIDVVAIIEFKPGTEETGLGAFQEAIPLVHKEDGCLAYMLHRDLDSPTRFVFIERWASDEHLEAHSSQPHLQEMLSKIGGLISTPPTVLRLTALPLGESAGSSL
jgi:quinol monooxygenase YgiN